MVLPAPGVCASCGTCAGLALHAGFGTDLDQAHRPQAWVRASMQGQSGADTTCSMWPGLTLHVVLS